jgi:hypothetical protein
MAQKSQLTIMPKAMQLQVGDKRWQDEMVARVEELH